MRHGAPSPFGSRLRSWRQQRGLSQLALAANAGTTPRHISFLETGRSRPSREMVLRVSEALDLPLRERNRLLAAAGWGAAYREADLDAAELAPFRATIDRMLGAHEPYPAMVVDGHWTVVAANSACSALFGADVVGANMVQRYYSDAETRRAIVNWSEVARAGLARLRLQQRHAPLDEELRALVELAEAAVDARPTDPAVEPDLVVCPHFRAGDRVIRTIGMVARFDTTLATTLDELRIELMYPRDAVADEFLREHSRRRDKDPGQPTGAGNDLRGSPSGTTGASATVARTDSASASLLAQGTGPGQDGGARVDEASES